MLLLLPLVVSPAGCGSPPTSPARPRVVTAPPPSAAVPSPDPCAIASKQRARVAGLLEQGRLDRAVRVIRRADALCPAGQPESAAALSAATAELDAGKEDGAKLIEAGLAAKRQGRHGEAQRLFDRGLARLAKAAGASPVLEFPDGLTQPVSHLAWSDNEIALTQGQLTTVVDASTLRPRSRRASKVEQESQSASTLDGTRLATVDGNTVRVTSASTGKELSKLVLPKDDYLGLLAFSLDGSKLAIGARAAIHVWDVVKGREVGKVSREGDRFLCQFSSVAFSPDGRKLVTVEEEKHGGSATAPCWAVAGVWELSTRTRVARFQADFATNVVSVAFSPDGSKVVSASQGDASFHADELTVNVWDASTGKELDAIRRHSLPLDSVSVFPQGTGLALSASDTGGCAEHKVFLWSAARGISELHGRGPVEFSADGSKLQLRRCSLAAPDGLALVETATGRELARLMGDWHVFSPVDESVLTWSAALEPGKSPRGVMLTRKADKAHLATFRLVSGSKAAYATTPDGYAELMGEGARKVAVCRVGQLSFPVEVCEERFVVPGLLARILAGDAGYAEP
ncbi:MAG: hypothetical protein HY898_22505 [Deltaproteobacteria bacterium]|nr:hypothetical protein [Deltaproteobacteria bacterium]